VVAGDAVAALGSDCNAAENVAAADDDADFDAHLAGFSDIRRNAVRHRYVDTEALAAHEGFAGSLE
jgi:hypothetical protein